MIRYRGVDWTKHKPPACNMKHNPSFPYLNDGLPINPLELVFVKAKSHLLASDLTLRRYTDYFLGRDVITTSMAHADEVQGLWLGRRQRLKQMVADCRATFDFGYYLAKYPHFAFGDADEIYDEFVNVRMMHGHEFR